MILIINNTLNHKDSMYFPLLIKMLKNTKGISYRVVASKEDLQKIPANKVSHIIISGSPLMVTPTSYVPNLDQFILNVVTILRYNVPVMGICFGCQLLSVLFGGSLRKLRKTYCDDAIMHYNKQSHTVRFCLNYVIKDVPPSFEVLGRTTLRSVNTPCFIRHSDRPIYGCLFHPEYHPETHQFILDFLEVGKKI